MYSIILQREIIIVVILEEIRQYLKSNLSVERFSHCEGVETASVQLAQRFNVPLDKCQLAGLSHDICREMPFVKLMEYTGLHHQNPILLHGIAGEKMLRDNFLIDDESVLKAVKYHISGTSGLDDIGKVIFIADFIEEGRSHLNKADRDRLFLLGLDDMVLDIAIQIREHLSCLSAVIDQNLVQLIDELQKGKVLES